MFMMLVVLTFRMLEWKNTKYQQVNQHIKRAPRVFLALATLSYYGLGKSINYLLSIDKVGDNYNLVLKTGLSPDE